MISMKNRIYGMLALLFMGSASIMAEGDPFGDDNPNKYSNTMSLAGCVYLNGEKLGTEAVVAAFCGNILRGKQSPNDQGELYLTIGGDYTGDKIYFKVYTGGRVIEVDQDLTYTNNATIGSVSEPYIITLPSPIVTTPTTEGWATTCLPFCAEVPSGVEVWNATAIENSELVMSKVTAGTILPANTPVLVKSEGLTSYEWLSKVAYDNASLISINSSLLRGTTEALSVTEKSVLTLGYSNEGNHELGFWLFAGTTINANRAYIADFPADSRGVTFRFGDYSNIASINHYSFLDEPSGRAERNMDHYYDLQGRRLNGQRSMFNGQSSMVNGQRSMVKGQFKKGSHGQIIIIK